MTLAPDFKHRDLIEKRSRHVTTRVKEVETPSEDDQEVEEAPPQVVPNGKKRKKKGLGDALTNDVSNAISAGVSKDAEIEKHGTKGRPSSTTAVQSGQPIRKRPAVLDSLVGVSVHTVADGHGVAVGQHDVGVLALDDEVRKDGDQNTPIVKHGTKGRPGYRLLHPGVGTGFSHRFESRGLSGKYPNARHENLKPRPLSGLGRGKGKFKDFMERDRRKLSDSKVSADVKARLSADQKAAAAAYDKSKAKYDGYGDKILAAKKTGNFTSVKASISRDKTLIPEHKKALLDAIAAEEKKAGKAAAPAKKVASAPKAAKKAVSAKPEPLHKKLHAEIDAAANTRDLEHLVDRIDRHGQKREIAPKHVEGLLQHVAERHVQHREERVGVKRPASLPPAKVAASPAKKAVKKPATKKPKTPDSAPARQMPNTANVKTGEGPNHLVVEVAPDFTDEAAMKAFLDKAVEEKGRKLVDAKRGDVIYMENDGPNAAKFAQLARDRGIAVLDRAKAPDKREAASQRKDILDQAAQRAENDRGRQHVVAFRNPGASFVDANHLPEQFVLRGSRRTGEGALIINPGYKAELDSAGEEIDPNAFGVTQGGVKQAVRDMRRIGAEIGDPEAPADGPDGNWANNGPPWPQAITTGTPAADHFKNGGHLADAPADGLFDYIFQQNGIEYGMGVTPGEEGMGHGGNLNGAPGGPGVRPTYQAVDPKRFRVTKMPSPGISSNYFVEELDAKGNPIAWRMFKGSSGFHAYDVEDEVLINDMLQRIGVQVPKVGFARNPAHKGPKWMVSEHAGVVIPGFDEANPGKVKIGDAGNMRDPGALRPYRDGVLMMDMLDWIIENPDRHGGNWMVAHMPDGSAKPVIIDNGGGFLFRQNRKQFGAGRQAGLLQRLYQGDTQHMDRDIQKIQAQLQTLDVDKLIETYAKQPGVSSDYKKHLQQVKDQLRMKLDALEAMDARDIRSHYGVR